jgi:hypothetical protein
MSARSTRPKSVTREAPIQFRPGTDLGRRVTQFSSEHRLSDPESCRRLIALAVNEMDGRLYGLVRQLAEAMADEMDFVRACIHIKTMVDGAALADEQRVSSEPNRSLFILKIVKEAMGKKGHSVDTRGLWFAREEPVTPLQGTFDPTKAKIRRKIRPVEKTEPAVSDVPELETEEKQPRVHAKSGR